MGLLDALKQYVSDSMPGGLLNPEWNKANGQRLAEELNRGLLESTGINARDKRRAWERNKLDAVSGSSDTKASLNQQAYDSAMAMAGMAPMGLTVWHGSPHKFSKFDMSKIGTGEGAQAYGHGLYMAESPQVALEYQRKLAGADNGMAGQIAANAMRGRTPEAAIEHLSSGLRGTPESQKVTRDAINLIKSGNANTGTLYKVDIPDEAVARMLDWDKPLSQQAPEVQDALKKTTAKYGPVRGNAAIYSDAAAPYMTGQDFYRDLANALSDGGVRQGSTALSGQDLIAAKHLQELGIHGIRYLDGGSRAGGQGTSNYVLFSDQLPRILEVNGKATGQTPWGAGEWQGLLGK